MNVYTRTPSLLDDTAYTAFGDDRALISPRKPQEGKWNLKEKYSDLGNSFLPTGPVLVEPNGMDLAEIGRSHQPSKLKIPSTFLQNNARRDDKAEVKTNKVIDVKKSLKTENNAERQKVVNGMIRERIQEGSIEDRNADGNIKMDIAVKEEENLEDVNRPTSKLIQDNENLQQLFDCVRGKEPSPQEVKSVGKLKLPTTFAAPLQNGKQNEGAPVRKGQEVRGSDSMAQAMAMPFDDWARKKEGNEEEVIDFKRGKANSEVQRDAGANTQGLRNSEYGMSAGKKFKEDRNSQTYVESDEKQYWLKKQNGSLAGNTGVKENINKIHGLNKEGMYDTTSNSADINGRHSDVSSIVAADRRDKTVSNKVGRLQVDGKIMQNRMNANSFERSMNESEQGKFGKNGDSRDKDETLSAGTGTKNIGKLTMPSAFLNSKSEENSGKREFIQKSVNGGVHQRMGTKKMEQNQSSLTAFNSESIGNKADRNQVEDPRDLSGFNENLNSKQVKEEQVKEKQNNDSGDIGKSNQVQEKKPVGKLNMHAIFQQKEVTEEREKKEDSMVTKNKAMFDQGGKKADTKQKGVGKLRLGSAKSERYKEIDNLSPAGQLPSSISNEMKEQLEKILQGRSGSVSSQASSSSSSSQRNDAKEVGRLSSSSLSSLNTSMSTPREDDLSARSLEDVFDEDKDDNCGQSKVNSGSLEFQLGNIFHNRKASSNSLSSSTSNSLNTSFNAGSEIGISMKEDGFPGNDIQNQASQSVIPKAPAVPAVKDKAEQEKTERRKLITDAIKLKYGTISGECSEGEDESLRANKRDEVEKIKTAETLPKEQKSTFDKFSNLQTEPTYSADILNAKKEAPTDNMPKRGRVSIPSVFGANPEVESSKVRFASQPTSFDKDRKTMNGISDVTDNGTPMENNSAAQSKKVSISSNFLSKHDAGQGNTKGPVLLNRGNSDSSDIASGKFNDNGSISPKKVNFKSEVGIIGKEDDKEKANLKPARSGKLSSSLMQAFQGGKDTGMKPVSMRPPTPGRQSTTKGFFREGWNEIRPETPAIEEEQVPKATNHGTQNILKLDGENSHGTEIVDNNKNEMNWVSTSANTPTGNDCEFSASSGQIDNIDSLTKKKVGKLSIPSMFQ